ncbi:hypothetical protein LSTR_LSTR015655 [Laodelphax striatellus]|uniref:Uncharacterized protein n=1 Tax=Laodelphax striatellus TaxID=195883 RepID=A0A482X028_LAOST|nr:hypothetical protein LSTR_LSTR015655 [Laodelphax striatellus]
MLLSSHGMFCNEPMDDNKGRKGACLGWVWRGKGVAPPLAGLCRAAWGQYKPGDGSAMMWTSAPLVLLTLLMALVSPAQVTGKNRPSRGRGSNWW